MEKSNTVLDFDSLRTANMSRVVRWHPNGISDWSPERWLGATTGELGEAFNALKKLWRIEDGIANKSEADRQIDTREQALEKIADEFADTLIYLDLAAASLGINLADAVRKKFNQTSIKYGYPERIGQHSVYLDASMQSIVNDVKEGR